MNTKAFNTMKNPSVLAVKKYSKLFGNIDNYYVFYQDYLNNFNEWEVFIARKEASFWEEQNEFEISLSDDIPIFQLPSEMKEKIIKRLTSIEGRNYAKISLVRLQSIQGIYKSVNHQAKSLLGQIDEIKLKE